MYHRYRKELTDIVVFHANWSSGLEEKQKMLEDMGLWFLCERERESKKKVPK